MICITKENKKHLCHSEYSTYGIILPNFGLSIKHTILLISNIYFFTFVRNCSQYHKTNILKELYSVSVTNVAAESGNSVICKWRAGNGKPGAELDYRTFENGGEIAVTRQAYSLYCFDLSNQLGSDSVGYSFDLVSWNIIYHFSVFWNVFLLFVLQTKSLWSQTAGSFTL